ncbi:hypothetical protein BOX17_05890 [Halomonas aestuarii]|uniref:MFS transporter n=1 Tax=Halomonas aestuarii TaxID=1897729 RepID=A0A1J0VEW5_9GAMM|nr:hypothetical protein [Halomonas aestuarii]APE30530.1 hypothetical protein BOX17_05890 [Halomonas aestuarii]
MAISTSLPESFLAMMAVTVNIGLGIAFVQAAMPVLAKLWSPERFGRIIGSRSVPISLAELRAHGFV